MNDAITLEDFLMILRDPEVAAALESEIRKEIDREIIRKICEEAGITPPQT